MNRRAKRNKFKKLKLEYERALEFYNSRKAFDCWNYSKLKVKQLSCFKPIEEFTKLPKEMIKEYYRKEVARQLAEEILNHNEIITVTDTGYGYRYDLKVLEHD